MACNSGLPNAFPQSTECLICAEAMSSHRLRSTGSCDHDAVCSICFLRLRTLLRDFSCPICKKSLDHVVCFDDNVSKFSNCTIWGDDAGPSFTFDHKSRMFFPKLYYEQRILPLWQCKCLCCDVVKKDVKTLRSHLNSDHNIRMCILCIENKQVFPSEQKTYTPSQYEVHLQKGDRDGSDGHPQCKFCQIRHYDKTSLFIHLKKDHYSCHICERDGIKYRYYENYRSLEVHFESSHFPCTETSCIEKRFVVFSNEIDLRAHTLQTHPSISINRTIPIHFKLRRNRGGGGGGENDDTDESSENPRNSSQLGFSTRDENNFERKSSQGETGNGSSSYDHRFDAGISGRVRNNGEWQIEFPPMLSSSSSSVAGLDTGVLRSTSSSSSNNTIATWVGAGWNSTPIVEDYPALPGTSSSASTSSSGLGHTASTSKVKGQNTKKGSSSSGGSKGNISSFRDAVNPPLSLAVMLHRGLTPPPPPPASTVTAVILSSSNISNTLQSYPHPLKQTKSKSVVPTATAGAKDFPPLTSSSSSSTELTCLSSPTTIPSSLSSSKPSKQSVPNASHISTILQSNGNVTVTSKSKKKITVKGLSVVKPDVHKASQGTANTTVDTNQTVGKTDSKESSDPFAGYKLLRNDDDDKSYVSWGGGGKEGGDRIGGGLSDYYGIKKPSSNNNNNNNNIITTSTATNDMSSLTSSLSLPLPPPPGYQPLVQPKSIYPNSNISSSTNNGWVTIGGCSNSEENNNNKLSESIINQQSIKQLSLDDSDYPVLVPPPPPSSSSSSSSLNNNNSNNGIIGGRIKSTTSNNNEISKHGVKSISSLIGSGTTSELKAPVTTLSSSTSKKNGKKTKIKNELINLAFQMKK